MPTQSKRGNFMQAVMVTVCVELDLASRISDAVSRLPWLLDISHLDSYSSATRRPAFGPQMRSANVGLVFIDFTQNTDQAIDCTQYLAQTYGAKLVIVAIGEEENSDLILQAMRAGCTEFLPYPATSSALGDIVRRLGQRWSSEAQQTSKDGTVLALFGAKGGVGTTTLAVHLALYLTQKHNKRVLLVDSQPELGHVCIYLGLDGTRFTFGEVVRNVNRLDSDLLHGFIAKHKSGLAVLSSPELSSPAPALDPHAVAKTLDFLRSEYEYVVIDCDRSLGHLTQTVLEAASRVYLVATPEVSAVRDISFYADRISRYSESLERLSLVLNRASSQTGLEATRIEQALKLPVQIKIPNDYPNFVKAGNQGVPIPPEEKLEVAQEIRRWAASLTQVSRAAENVQEKTKRSLSSWSFWSRRATGSASKEANA